MAGAWEAEAKERKEFGEPRQGQTIYRWVSDGVPVKGDFASADRSKHFDNQIFAFCSLLDVDPLAIFDYDRNGYFSSFAKIRQLIYMGSRWLGGLAPLLEMYRPADAWPSDQIAKKYFKRNWCSEEFTNEDYWKTTDYILLKIKFTIPVLSKPRAIHIAYRRVGVPDTMWRYYGTVTLVDSRLDLYNESGTHQSMRQVANDEIRFRTYYGGRPVVWRVASLHDFKLDREFPFNDMTTIGFNW
jgi:hypothetical protein